LQQSLKTSLFEMMIQTGIMTFLASHKDSDQDVPPGLSVILNLQVTPEWLSNIFLNWPISFTVSAGSEDATGSIFTSVPSGSVPPFSRIITPLMTLPRSSVGCVAMITSVHILSRGLRGGWLSAFTSRCRNLRVQVGKFSSHR